MVCNSKLTRKQLVCVVLDDRAAAALLVLTRMQWVHAVLGERAVVLLILISNKSSHELHWNLDIDEQQTWRARAK